MWAKEDGTFSKLVLSDLDVVAMARARVPDDVPDDRLKELLRLAEEEPGKPDPVENLHGKFKREHRRMPMHVVGRVHGKELAALRRSAKRAAYE